MKLLRFGKKKLALVATEFLGSVRKIIFGKLVLDLVDLVLRYFILSWMRKLIL